jgi:hypothetical protein
LSESGCPSRSVRVVLSESFCPSRTLSKESAEGRSEVGREGGVGRKGTERDDVTERKRDKKKRRRERES